MADKRDVQINNTSNATLDLGLSMLLSGLLSGDHPRTAIENEAHHGEPIEATRETSNEDGLVESEYQQLANQKKWGELVGLAETRLSQGDDSEVRLWWIHAHLQKRSMPTSFLVAPFDSLLPNTDSFSKNELNLLSQTAGIIHSRLTESGDSTLVQGLERSLQTYQVSLPLSERPGVEKELITAARLVSNTSFEQKPIVGNVDDQKNKRSHSHRFGLAAGGLIIIGAIAAGYVLYGKSGQYLNGDVTVAYEDFLEQSASPELMIPALDRRDIVGSLSALYYSIDNAEASQENSPSVVKTSATEAQPTEKRNKIESVPPPPGPKEQKVAKEQGDSSKKVAPVPTNPPPKSAKEKINTKGPLEAPDFQKRIAQKRNRTETQTTRGPVQPSLPADAAPQIVMGMSQGGYAAGSLYRVITKTSVIAEPSYSGRIIGRLEPGDKVLVEAKVGGWLRLRSVRGRGGFVLAQDVSEGSEEDFKR